MDWKDKLKALCRERGVTIAKLERDLGYSNASIATVKNLRGDRLKEISAYFEVPISFFCDEEITDKYMDNEEHTLVDMMRMKPYLKELLFAGGKMSEEQVEAILCTMNILEERKKIKDEHKQIK